MKSAGHYYPQCKILGKSKILNFLDKPKAIGQGNIFQKKLFVSDLNKTL